MDVTSGVIGAPFGIANRRAFDFGPLWGVHKCAPLFFPEMRAMPELFPSLHEAGTYHATNAFADGVALPLAMIGMRIAPHRAKDPQPVSSGGVCAASHERRTVPC